MAFFNFIETFFFISLGITFVLILLLVYHFKQRMTGLEQKCDTMFEIINDVVKELNLLRIQNTMQQTPHPGFFQPMHNFMPQFNIDDVLNKNASNDDDDVKSEDSDESSDVGNSDEDSEEEDVVEEEEQEHVHEEEQEQEQEKNEVVQEANENVVKIINVNQETLTELDVESLSINNEEQEQEQEQLDEEESEDDDEFSVSNHITEEPVETILVEKIEPLEEVETNSDPTDSKESDKEVYKKMSLGALKALVISKGLCSDARTMRKNELLKLLEEE